MSWILLAAATPLLTAVGYFSHLPWLLPLLQAAPAYSLMICDLRRGKPQRAVIRMLTWALLIAITVSLLTLGWPSAGAASVVHGAAYRDEMVEWVRTGVGKESTPSQFIPEHLTHLAIFILLSLATGSLLGLVMGAVLMNYMSFYVGSLISLSARPLVAVLAGWPPWSILRVISFVILGVALSLPLLRKLGRLEFQWGNQKSWVMAAAVGLMLDILLKTLLADTWSQLLRAALAPLP